MAIVGDRRRADRAVRGDHRLRAERLQEGAGLLDGQPARLHVRGRRHRQLRRAASSTSVTHAFFKAGLFLGAGSVMHAMSGSGDITIMGGLRKKLPWTHGVFLVCWLAICGIPFFSGFFSKDAIIAGAFATEVYGHDLAWVGKLVGGMLMLAALGTAFYMSRLYFLVFSGDETRAADEIKHHIHESPQHHGRCRWWCWRSARRWSASSASPAACSTTPSGTCSAHWLEPVLGPELRGLAHHRDRRSWSASTLLALVGIGLAYVVLRRRLPASRRAGFAGRVPRLRPPGAGQVPHRRALRRPDHPPDQGARARPVHVRRPHHHRQDPGRGHRRRSSTCSRGSRAPCRAATASATWRCSPSASRCWSHFASQPTVAVHQAEGHVERAAPSRSTRAAAAASPDAPARIRVRLRRRTPESSRARPPSRATTTIARAATRSA